MTQDPEGPDKAAQLSKEHRRWFVMWGSFTREYLAFPRFGQGGYLADTDPANLVKRMSQWEQVS